MLDRSKAPQIKPFGPLTLPGEEVTILSNGLVLHTLNGGDQEVVRLDLVAEGGTADCDNPCIASFAAELLREANTSQSSDEIADLIDYNGAWLNSSASGHFTTLQLSSLASKLENLAPTVIECFTQPQFPVKAFEIIRAKGAARQKLNFSRVSFLANSDNRKLMSGNDHPESFVPSIAEIEAISRENLTDFHQKILSATRTHAYLCGRFSSQQLDRLCSILETIPTADSPSPIHIVPFSPATPTTNIIRKTGSLQSAVVMSLPAIPRSHPDYNALRMTVTALGGYFGSRLMMNIREDKGYTYGISASLLGSAEGSYISIAAQCDNRYTEALIDEVRSELRRMAEEPLTDEELTKLKFNVASDLASTLDSPMTVMDYYELIRTVGIPEDYFYARQKTVDMITKDMICELSRRYLDPAQLRISIAGDL